MKGLDKEQQSSLIDAMFEKKVKKNEEVITQGDKGDNYYVIESGIFEVWKSVSSKPNDPPKKVFSYNNKGSFGELALLYNESRAASVRAATDGVLWVVDGETFRYIMISSRAKKRARFYEFLKTVDLFRNISGYVCLPHPLFFFFVNPTCKVILAKKKKPDDVRNEVADTLEVFQFEKGEYVISQAEENAEYFYMIQKGSVEITLNIPNWNEIHKNTYANFLIGNAYNEMEREKYVKTLREGAYFGERALLFNCERSANVIVSSQLLRCVAMDKASFLRLCDKLSVFNFIRRNIDQYTFNNDKLLSSSPCPPLSSPFTTDDEHADDNTTDST
ncbi:hypothetical protein RFI_16616 [Reticulomyxa filosa]|uniref:Cyclic nucleotide-binding domain-containing protein n=1 Tax=Reticulomyxa filosa TaxID=46433 RepID=X6N5L5_RETFI|nr:hypothetical protein RFI_16616 [Reticulomyxa filosa]|eukprot:ETO20602.1 hypothetical protein RFI_16616 [Reticulomyxa filosa]